MSEDLVLDILASEPHKPMTVHHIHQHSYNKDGGDYLLNVQQIQAYLAHLKRGGQVKRLPRRVKVPHGSYLVYPYQLADDPPEREKKPLYVDPYVKPNEPDTQPTICSGVPIEESAYEQLLRTMIKRLREMAVIIEQGLDMEVVKREARVLEESGKLQ